MLRSRRTFLKYVIAGGGAAMGALGYWLSSSRGRTARFARRMIDDAQRNIAPAPARPNPAAWSENQISLCWIGHSTVLINFFGIRILTDPVLGNRAGVSLGPFGSAGIKRFVAPALQFKELGLIDVLLLSHAHMDHLDLPTLKLFPSGTFTVSSKDTADLLAKARRTAAVELRWGDRARFRNALGELEIEAFEVKHWGQRWPSEVPRGYNGYVLRREGKALLFGGDTAQISSFAALRPHGPFAVAIMPIGAYRPWIRNHCTPEQAFAMADAAGAQYLVPIHHQTFCLSEEPLEEPMQRLQAAMETESERLAIRRIGESFFT